MDPDLLERVWAASGLRDQTHAYDEDLEALRLVTTALQFGFPLDALSVFREITCVASRFC